MADDEPGSDVFGRAIRDHHRGERTTPLWQCDGPERREHPIEAFYFGEFDADGDRGSFLRERLGGPLIDLGAGAGRDALYFQDRFKTVALESSPALVETMRERGVADARQGDMFDLRASFGRDCFDSALAYGTQIGLAGSMAGLRAFLADLAFVTKPDATAVVDCYDPTRIDPNGTVGDDGLFSYRADPTPGLARRVLWFEYGGTADPALHFRLFSPDRLRDATVGTDWTVAEVHRTAPDAIHYLAALESRGV